MLATTLAYVRARYAHSVRCSANPEVGCVCGWDQGDDVDDDGIARLDEAGLATFDAQAALVAAEMRGAA
jgi:hypothetical protein